VTGFKSESLPIFSGISSYSLPPTDLKSQALFNLTLRAPTSGIKELVVIDISRDARIRWRRQFVAIKFRGYEGVEKYLAAEGLT
jgi:hypothetical protein